MNMQVVATMAVVPRALELKEDVQVRFLPTCPFLNRGAEHE